VELALGALAAEDLDLVVAVEVGAPPLLVVGQPDGVALQVAPPSTK